MSFLEINEVELLPQDGRLRHLHLDHPKAGRQPFAYSFEFGGWMVPADAPVADIEFCCDDALVHKGRAGKRRPDVSAHLRETGAWPPEAVQAAEFSGFHEGVSVVGLPAAFELRVDAVFQDGSRAALAVVRGSREPLRLDAEPELRPIIISHLGRSGSTLLMQMLSRHPEIVAIPRPPIEACMASHAARMFSTLATPCPAPANKEVGMMAESVDAVGPLPFCCEADSPRVHEWIRDGHVRRLGAFALDTMDAFYREAAREQGRDRCRFFAEKFFTRTGLASVLTELCPSAREIFLVRDFRDVVCSRYPGNPAVFVLPPEEKLARTVEGALRLVARWRRVSGKAALVRYEDLIHQPGATLAALFARLGVGCSPETVSGVLAERPGDAERRKAHASSPGPLQSVGRWQRDLSPERQAFLTAELAVPLREFGYLVDGG